MRVRQLVLSLLLGCVACAPMQPAASKYELHTEAQNGQMIIANPQGERVRLMSVNWFGFESGAFVIGGLSASHSRTSSASSRRAASTRYGCRGATSCCARHPSRRSS